VEAIQIVSTGGKEYFVIIQEKDLNANENIEKREQR
jgi:hypothetical protein